ncbi:hypothetical protein PYCCODRAFT_47881 [Trametes coccinea BRFM310]|uniref:Uncharacterized protein n=1 Tax=Trametes coccinea (strain BRFM310) TaxID=1353009 RepID=A0A1Y2J736_TRAC3|nr:hypothetical protein PYCCODRAFT_47881 [Trametes coccinea BRFM310]
MLRSCCLWPCLLGECGYEWSGLASLRTTSSTRTPATNTYQSSCSMDKYGTERQEMKTCVVASRAYAALRTLSHRHCRSPVESYTGLGLLPQGEPGLGNLE